MDKKVQVLIVDAQGGGIGKQLITAVKQAVPAVEITAVGANSAATAAMMKAGADQKLIADNVELGGEMKEPEQTEVKSEVKPEQTEVNANDGGMEVAHGPEMTKVEPEQTEDSEIQMFTMFISTYPSYWPSSHC